MIDGFAYKASIMHHSLKPKAMSDKQTYASCISEGRAVMGIELGSTRIKAVLIDPNGKPLAQGSHTWENRFENGHWTYSEADIWEGMAAAYASLKADVAATYGVELTRLASIGVSAMMHGYLAFNAEGQLLAPFRTWRNTNTGRAAAALSEAFSFNIPLRWSISHIYQVMLDGEAHASEIDFLTTLAGYVHWRLTGEKVLGIGDASGMIPVDPETKNYNARMVARFDELAAPFGYSWKLEDILPKVLMAGEKAGYLTEEGARLLDASGKLQAGALFCPPEGDAGTGMVATNAVRPRTGNVSAGTSSFSMIVLEKDLSKPYEPIDIVTTPDGYPVAMVHCNNCTSDLNAWVGLFGEVASLFGDKPSADELFGRLYRHALEGDADCGGLMGYNYVSGEPVVGLENGCPMFMRPLGSKFSLANFMRTHLYGTVAVLKIGNDILFDIEKVGVDRITGHGGLFRTAGVGQSVLAAALNAPISVMETAGEGGAWGIALLALYAADTDGKNLADYLDAKIFADAQTVTVAPKPEDVEGFRRYLVTYEKSLPVEKQASEL